MAMVSIADHDMARYLTVLQGDPEEIERLAQDLLINVTSFFRDPTVWDVLATKVIPELVDRQLPDRPLRMWTAGCSTGEETYTIAMLYREVIGVTGLGVKLQIFASDVDPDAIEVAREGLYPETIEADVSAARLARFFVKEGRHYRVLPDLRAAIVFTVQDVLADPPFSRLDLVSCRNLLIYLRPEAQSKVISLFHFALREGGVLLLGSTETIGSVEGQFEVISKPERLYRHMGRKRLGEFSFSIGGGTGSRIQTRPGVGPVPARQTDVAELCRRIVLENYAPAAILINANCECLYSIGPTDRYLQVAPGYPTHDLLAMVDQELRSKLRSAIQQALKQGVLVTIPGHKMPRRAIDASFMVEVRPVLCQDEELLLVSFLDVPMDVMDALPAIELSDIPRVAELEQELFATRTELQAAIWHLEISAQEQKAINEEALSVNEEYQSTNEELLTSKEELQSLNEELTALNSQLQETLEKQRTTSDDLQNILYSTDVATLFLDTNLNIRFFTPATKSLFNLIPSDIGRPLGDLSSLAPDGTLMNDARTVLKSLISLDREIEAQNGSWYNRRILPYRTQDDRIGGVVITFSDITVPRHAGELVIAAKQQAEMASVAKSRFLAAASHDLRQPLQTLVLLQGLLANTVEGEKSHRLVVRLEETLMSMSGILNALLDINRIEIGMVQAERVVFPINDLLTRLRDEFSYHAHAKGLVMRTVNCGKSLYTDPRLLEQMIRNLLSNAIKYTKSGTVLLGCRYRPDALTIEIWDTGIGISDDAIGTIFDEYHQLNNSAYEDGRGLGLGLSIVKRLGALMGHKVRVCSQPGKGTVFSIEVGLRPIEVGTPPKFGATDAVSGPPALPSKIGTILIIEDNLEVRDLLELLLKEAGHKVTAVFDGIVALDLVARGMVRPDLILADFNLPNGLNGLELATKLRQKLHRDTPVIILTGDISTSTLLGIKEQHCVGLSKPVKLIELIDTIERLLPSRSSVAHPPMASVSHGDDGSELPIILVVDDDGEVRAEIRELLENDGKLVVDYPSCEAFFADYEPGREACLLLDANLPGMSGLELLRRINDNGYRLPIIMITGNGDIAMVVEAMKSGASDFIEKPFSGAQLLASIEQALEQARDSSKLYERQESAALHVAALTPRQHEIMGMVLAGNPNKNIASDLGISQRTVENHRATIMQKMGADSLPALARLAMAAAQHLT